MKKTALMGYPFNRTGCRLSLSVDDPRAGRRTIRGPLKFQAWFAHRSGPAMDYLEWLALARWLRAARTGATMSGWRAGRLRVRRP